MTGELRKALGLPEINRPEGANGNGEFSQDFRDGLAGVNQDMQIVAARGGQVELQKLDANRQTLIAAYQNAASLGDASKNGQVLAAVAKVKQQTSAKATTIQVGYEEWQKRESDFDAALLKIGKLEEAGHAKAPAFRSVSDEILNRANGRDYPQASSALDQLLPKLERIHSEFPQPNGSSESIGTVSSSTEDRDAMWKEIEEIERRLELLLAEHQITL